MQTSPELLELIRELKALNNQIKRGNGLGSRGGDREDFEPRASRGGAAASDRAADPTKALKELQTTIKHTSGMFESFAKGMAGSIPLMRLMKDNIKALSEEVKRSPKYEENEAAKKVIDKTADLIKSYGTQSREVAKTAEALRKLASLTEDLNKLEAAKLQKGRLEQSLNDQLERSVELEKALKGLRGEKKKEYQAELAAIQEGIAQTKEQIAVQDDLILSLETSKRAFTTLAGTSKELDIALDGMTVNVKGTEVPLKNLIRDGRFLSLTQQEQAQVLRKLNGNVGAASDTITHFARNSEKAVTSLSRAAAGLGSAVVQAGVNFARQNLFTPLENYMMQLRYGMPESNYGARFSRAMLGLSSEGEISEFAGENIQQLRIATGGSGDLMAFMREENVNVLKEMGHLRGLIGRQALDFSMGQLTLMQQSGIAQNIESVRHLTEANSILAKAMSETPMAVDEMMRGLGESGALAMWSNRMAGMAEEERTEAILQSVKLMAIHNKSLGYTNKQMEEQIRLQNQRKYADLSETLRRRIHTQVAGAMLNRFVGEGFTQDELNLAAVQTTDRALLERTWGAGAFERRAEIRDRMMAGRQRLGTMAEEGDVRLDYRDRAALTVLQQFTDMSMDMDAMAFEQKEARRRGLTRVGGEEGQNAIEASLIAASEDELKKFTEGLGKANSALLLFGSEGLAALGLEGARTISSTGIGGALAGLGGTAVETYLQYRLLKGLLGPGAAKGVGGAVAARGGTSLLGLAGRAALPLLGTAGAAAGVGVGAYMGTQAIMEGTGLQDRLNSGIWNMLRGSSEEQKEQITKAATDLAGERGRRTRELRAGGPITPEIAAILNAEFAPRVDAINTKGAELGIPTLIRPVQPDSNTITAPTIQPTTSSSVTGMTTVAPSTVSANSQIDADRILGPQTQGQESTEGAIQKMPEWQTALIQMVELLSESSKYDKRSSEILAEFYKLLIEEGAGMSQTDGTARAMFASLLRRAGVK